MFVPVTYSSTALMNEPPHVATATVSSHRQSETRVKFQVREKLEQSPQETLETPTVNVIVSGADGHDVQATPPEVLEELLLLFDWLLEEDWLLLLEEDDEEESEELLLD